MSRLKDKAVKAINERGILLVYPLDNRKEPASIWSELYPKTKMRWEWDSEGDNRVANLWMLREELSRSHEVIYMKWYRGRATFFSLELFKAVYKLSRRSDKNKFTNESHEILEILQMDSPMSTKQIKEAVSLQGKLLEKIYEKSMKSLWQRFDIAAFGEFQDSSFPSLGIGATETLFEDIVVDSLKLSDAAAIKIFHKYFPVDSVWLKFWNQLYGKDFISQVPASHSKGSGHRS